VIPTNDDLTSKRIDSKWRSTCVEFADLYQRRKTYKPGFFEAWDAEEPLMVDRLKKRPLPLTEIENLFGAFRAKMLKAL
jgi:hypothetical protein